MKRVFVCCDSKPTEENLKRTRAYCAWTAGADDQAPFAPGLLYPQFTDYAVPTEAEAAIDAAHTFLRACDVIHVFVVGGVLSPDMKAAVHEAFTFEIPVYWFAVSIGPDILDVQALTHIDSSTMPKPADLLAPKEFAVAASSKLEQLASRLRAGEFYEDCDEGLDDLLGTTMEDRDRDVEEAWEEDLKGGNA